MLFNSPAFILFYLPAVFFGFFLIAKASHRLAALWLVAASVFFYGYWNPKFVSLLLASATFNYAMGYAIGHARSNVRQPRLFLIAAITANLVLLGIFKYTNFFIASVNSVANTNIPLAHIILPLGISFFTFTQIAFLVDVYRGVAREYNFIHYLLFVTYFPHLIAGPVLHHKQMMPQFGATSTYRIATDNVAIGLSFFLIGLAKKVVLADSLALYATPVFEAANHGTVLTLLEAWGGALAYTFQLYFDFSGYSDMAIGLSKMFGVDLPINFNSPYKSQNITEFWRRWHMTLSQFLRDYLYIPLGGNRLGRTRRYINLMITMLLGGLWHGASWTFVGWGGLHGLYLVINHGWHGLKRHLGILQSEPTTVEKTLGMGLTFLAVVVAWVFFRAPSTHAALIILEGMSGANGTALPEQIAALFPMLSKHIKTVGNMSLLGGGTVMGVVEQFSLTLLAAVICFAFPNSQNLSFRAKLLITVACAGFVIQGVFFGHKISEFLYFQF